ncbi:MAG: DUF6788 family protein [Candidatus Sulfotelmatobacter sp.]
MSRSRQQATTLHRYTQRFRELRQELQQLDFFCKGTVLKRMMKCGRAHCACHRDPTKRHGPYFEWTYKAKGTTVNVKLSPQTAPLYQAAAKQYRQLKTTLHRLERLSRTALTYAAKNAQQGRGR